MSKITWKPGTLLSPGSAGLNLLRNGQKSQCHDSRLDRHHCLGTADDLCFYPSGTLFA